jgi:hypothetical protein
LLLLNEQSSTTFEDHLLLFNEEDQEVPCHIILIKIQNSFVLFTRNETNIIQKQKEVESRKISNENLLNQIFPKDIVDRNLNETNNSFSVQSSSIIFISITDFSDFSVKLGPEELVNCLSFLFGALIISYLIIDY